MILQALTDYYRVLEQAGKIDAPGWAPVKVSYALLLSENGTLEQVLDIQTEQPRGKKMVSAPQILSLPAPVKRTVGVAANFLCDNAGYLLGIDSKGKPQRTRECFEASRSLHEQLLAGVDSPAARAVAAFFRSWDPETAREHPALAEHLEDILSGGNLIFRTLDGYVHRDPSVRRAWDAFYQAEGDGPQGSAWSPGSRDRWKASTPPSKMWRVPSPAERPWCPSTPRPSAPTERSRTSTLPPASMRHLHIPPH